MTSAWSNGQNLSVYGVVYALSDGLLKPLVGPITGEFDASQLERDFVERASSQTFGRRLPILTPMKDADSSVVMEQNNIYVQTEVNRHLLWSDTFNSS